MIACSVLSGNRNFEGRVHPEVRQNFLASPPLVVAYALAGTLDLDLTTQPLGTDKNGKPVMLADIWPTDREVQEAVTQFHRLQHVPPELRGRVHGRCQLAGHHRAGRQALRVGWRSPPT